MKKFIAITSPGSEYIYSRSSAHFVPVRSADMICSALNRSRYNLKSCEIWHIYTCDDPDAIYQKFYIRKGKLFSAYT